MSGINEVTWQINTLKDTLKDECDELREDAERHTNDADAAERLLDSKMNNIQRTFNTEFEGLRQNIKRRKPNPSEANYEQKERTYVEFINQVTSLNGPLELLGNWFKSLFNKLKEIIATIVEWIAQAVQYVATKIRNIFQAIVSFFS